MQDNDFLNLLLRLEKSFPVNSLKIDQSHIWPLVRLRINTRRKYALNDHHNRNALIWIFRVILSYIINQLLVVATKQKNKRLDKQIDQILSNVESLKKSDLLLVCLEKEHYYKVENKLFAPLIDSIKLLSEGTLNSTKVSLGWKSELKPYYETENLNLSPFVAKAATDSLKSPRRLRTLIQSIVTITWLGVLSTYIRFINSSYSLNIEEILELITKMKGQRVLFKKLLLSVNPKAVLMTSYIGRIGLVSAAKQLNIPVFDIQHGGMYKDHALSANWNKIPDGGYDYLPDYFWCWSQQSVKFVESSDGSENFTPRAFLGGHPWLGVCLSEYKNRLISVSQEKYLDHLDADNRTTILLALQYGAGSSLDKFVVDLIKETSSTWKWLIRLHPMGRDLKDELVKDLMGLESVEEIDTVTELPLHILLPKVDHVITGFSSIGTEALNFGIRTTIFSPVGYKFFQHEITSGIYDYADNKTALKESIERNHTFINDDLNAMTRALPTNTQDILAFKDFLENINSERIKH